MTSNRSIPLLLLTLATCAGCGGGKKDPSPAETEKAVHVIPVQVAVAGQENLSVTKIFSGSLEGEEQANIVAKLSERVTGVKIHVGEQVTAGQVTITLDKSGASSQYFQAEANFKNAEKTLERMKSLYAEGAISAQTLDGTQTAYDVASANFQAARGSVDLASPVSGQVTAVNVNVGDLPVPGMVLATVAKIGRMKVIFNINESDLSNIAVGQSVEVYSEARPSALLEGRVIQTSKSADIRSRSFELKAIFQNSPDRWFKPGMYVKVRARLSPRANALVIPAGAVVSDGVTNRVFLIRSGRAYQKAVTLGVSDGERTEVLGGLALLDTVATTGVTNLKDSSFVNVVLTK